LLLSSVPGVVLAVAVAGFPAFAFRFRTLFFFASVSAPFSFQLVGGAYFLGAPRNQAALVWLPPSLFLAGIRFPASRGRLDFAKLGVRFLASDDLEA
jgi:hypothetical protein